ncbi:MAG: LysM peptidoglycan-binding domain-containing protein, partial [Okeania sp. SIO4D6]|nr:LysM peptidoglycan-binding domain-containing protein [Okeania sp. SIO4D6]
MKLDKLTITPLKKKGQQSNLSYCKKGEHNKKECKVISVQFNPETYSISKSVNWEPQDSSRGEGTNTENTERKVNAPTIQFKGGGSRQLTLELFFDVTEAVDRDDVREETNKIVALTRIEREEDHPQVCEVAWGEAPVGSDFPFIGVITSLTQNFTLFKANGKPLRANLSLTFLEFLAPLVDKRKTDPELTTRIIKGGDTLSDISAQFYNNPKLWRIIAQANQLDDPRNLEMQIGRTL